MRCWCGYLSRPRCKCFDATATPSSLVSLKSRVVNLSGACFQYILGLPLLLFPGNVPCIISFFQADSNFSYYMSTPKYLNLLAITVSKQRLLTAGFFSSTRLFSWLSTRLSVFDVALSFQLPQFVVHPIC